MLESGNSIYLRWSLELPSDPPIAPADDHVSPTFDTADVVLKTVVIEDQGDMLTVEWFSTQRTVERSYVHPATDTDRVSLDDEQVYPAHNQSPYTSTDDLAEDIKRERGDAE